MLSQSPPSVCLRYKKKDIDTVLECGLDVTDLAAISENLEEKEEMATSECRVDKARELSATEQEMPEGHI